MAVPEPYYKVLDKGGEALYGRGAWGLPRGSRPGCWEKATGELAVCRNGLHLCRRGDLVRWLGPRIFEVETRGDELIVSSDKVVVREARLVRELAWDERVARLFVADCAERVLPIFEAQYPDDDRPRIAIEIARQFAMGAVDDAARAAAGDAAWAAAAEADADAAALATAMAGAAAWAAAWAAAGDAARARFPVRAAAWAAAGRAAWAWQTERLFEYLGK